MGKIFCLMGKSSSGKDTIFKELSNDKKLNLKSIILYTTRPKRLNEKDGNEYFFINEDILNQYEDKIIEVRKYNTIKGIWYYATIDDGQINLDKHNYITIVTLEAYNNFKNYFGSDNVFPIYINVEDGVRLERAMKREKEQIEPNYDELCRRFLADNKDFSNDNLKKSGINKEYLNYDFYECLSEIKKQIINKI